MKKRILGILMVTVLVLSVVFVQKSTGQEIGINRPQITPKIRVISKGDIVVGPVRTKNVYTMECYDKYGNFKWREKIHNLVTTNGLNMLLAAAFQGQSSANWYAILVGDTSGGGFSVSDSQTSHPGWVEFTTYSGGRPLLSFPNPPSNGHLSNDTARFTISSTGNMVINGAGIIDTATTGGTWGLYALGATSLTRPMNQGDYIFLTLDLANSN